MASARTYLIAWAQALASFPIPSRVVMPRTSLHRTKLLCALLLFAACKGSDPVQVATVDAVEVTPSALTLVVGDNQTLAATPKSNGTALSGKSVTWQSNNNAVATVSGSGAVHAVAAGTASISASVEGKSGNSSITVNNVAATASSLSPSSVTAGGAAFTITVTGTNFVSGAEVRWNGVARTTTFVSSTQMTASIASADVAVAGTSMVTVVNPTPGGGASSALTFTINAAVPPPNPAPTLNTVAPSSVIAGSTAFTLAVNGTNFIAASEVRWNGVARTTTFVSATQLTAQIAAADIATAGTAQLSVFTPTPGGGTSRQLPFTISAVPQNPAPVLTTVIPSAYVVGGPAFTLTVLGTGFIQGSQVRWNGSARTTTYVSATNLTATITASDVATMQPVQVTVFTAAPGGGASSAQSFTISAPVTSAITVGGAHACAIKSTGAAQCWGSAQNGRLGNGSDGTSSLQAAYSSTPVSVSGGVQFKRISAGDLHTCAVSVTAAMFCWGYGLNGRLGTGSAFNSTTPAQSGQDSQWAEVSSGAAHTCALTTTGDAWCWGKGTDGVIGNGATIDVMIPTAVSGGHKFTAISAGGGHSCALTADGVAWCWGAGGNGQLGVIGSSNVPVAVSGGLTFTNIAAGAALTCGATGAGKLYCWGVFQDPNPSQPKLQVFGQSVRSVSISQTQQCVITPADAAYCAGTNSMGEAGNGTRGGAGTFVRVVGGHAFRSVATNGARTTCAMTTSGNPYCWGAMGNHGMLGNGTISWSPTPVAVTGGFAFREAGVGDSETCALTVANALYCWGTLGDRAVALPPDVAAPSFLNTPTTLSSVSGGVAHFCGLTSIGSAYCWGSGSSGQLGQGVGSGSSAPIAVTGALAFASISPGSFTTCATTQSNALYCWGAASLGQPRTNVPFLVAGGANQAYVTGGSQHRCTLSPAGLARCWGDNLFGQLGDGTSNTRTTPTSVSTALTFTKISAGFSHTCAIATGGDAYCWGDGSALGNGSSLMKSQPTLVSGGLHFTHMVAGSGFTCALTTASATYCWGKGGRGVLGDNDQTTSALAPQLVNVPSLMTLASSGDHTCGITAAGAMYCWGNNVHGQLGNGAFGFSTVPVAVSW